MLPCFVSATISGMNDVGPTYCETLIAQGTGFPIEFVNTWTSLIPALLGLLAVLYLIKHKNRRADLWALAVLTIATGLGSTWWHGARTGISLAFDVFPGLLYFLLFLYLWPAYLFGKWRGALAFIAFFAVQFVLVQFLPFGERNGPPVGVFATTFLFAVVYLVATYRKIGRPFWWGVAMITSALTAALFRTIDLETCATLPFGTHFLWHVFLGLAAYLGVRFLSHLERPWWKFWKRRTL